MRIATTLDRPTPKNGRLTLLSPAGNCVILYRSPTDEDLDVQQCRAALAASMPDPAKLRSELQRARRQTVIIGWEDVYDQADQPIEFTQDRLLALMLRVPVVGQAVMELLDRLYEVESIVLPPPSTM